MSPCDQVASKWGKNCKIPSWSTSSSIFRTANLFSTLMHRYLPQQHPPKCSTIIDDTCEASKVMMGCPFMYTHVCCPTHIPYFILERSAWKIRKICLWMAKISSINLLKVISRKLHSIKGVDSKICLGYLLGKECPDSKNSGVLKTAESDNFKNVNYIVIGRFLTILWWFSQQKRSFYCCTKNNHVFFCENRHKIVKNRPITI